MDEQETTNLPEADELEAEVGTEVQDDFEPQLDADGNPIEDQVEPEEEEFEEIERNGKKAKVPAWLKPELMMQADYTRKTTELSEARKAFEAERQSAHEADEQEHNARVSLTVLDSEIDRLSKINWNAAHDEDPFECQKAFAQFQLMKDARARHAQALEEMTSARKLRTQQESAKRLQEGHAELQKHIPDWSPATAAKLQQFATQTLNFTPQELETIEDPRVVRALHAASQWYAEQAKTKKVRAIQQQQEVKPAEPVRRSSAPANGLDDRLSAEEWTRRRNEQLRKRG